MAPIRPVPAIAVGDSGDKSNRSVMVLLQIIVLALIQGITEFLPISSSGHLLLVPAVTG